MNNILIIILILLLFLLYNLSSNLKISEHFFPGPPPYIKKYSNKFKSDF